MWQLIYGNSKADPVLLVLAICLPHRSDPALLTAENLEAWAFLKKLSEKSKIPLLLVQFACDQEEIDSVYVSTDGISFEKKSMEGLTELFHQYGLPTSKTPTRKAKNDKESSAYHTWQRQSLGKDLTVTDIDLWKLDEGGNVTTIFELKRSLISIDKWQPYPEDFKNFILLIKICELSAIEFKISYNYMSPKPTRIEDISKIKVFKLVLNGKVNAIYEGIYPLKDFIK
jgi:hypothetical protein